MASLAKNTQSASWWYVRALLWVLASSANQMLILAGLSWCSGVQSRLPSHQEPFPMKSSPLLLMLAVLHLCGTAAVARTGMAGAEPGHLEGPGSAGLSAAQCGPRVPLS